MNGSFCWPHQQPTSRNEFALFQLGLNISSPVDKATLTLFADTRYRLSVNGEVVGHGPARFYPSSPEFDPFDLKPLLRQGQNTILVEVWSSGSANFQSVEAPGVFHADGEISLADGSRISLESPGKWMSRVSRARAADSIPLSFAIGPVEVLDTEALKNELADSDEWTTPVAVETGHGIPRPRSIPPLQCALHYPTRVMYAGPGEMGGETRVGAFCSFPEFINTHHGRQKSDVAVCVTYLHSPTAQTVPLGLFWCDCFLNGEPLERTDVSGIGNRQAATANLRPGWNCLAMAFDVFAEVWGLPLGFPKSAGLRLACLPDDSAAEGFQMSPMLHAHGLERPDLAVLSSSGELPPTIPWSFVPADSIGLAPAREVGWDRSCWDGSPVPYEPGSQIEIQTGADGVAILTFDMGVEFLGHPSLSVECEHALITDVSCEEFLRPDNTINMFRGLWSVHSTDRFICPPGRSTLRGFHNRGGIYLQFNFRTTPGAIVRVRDVAVHEFKTPANNVGEFSCDDEFWNWTWNASVATLHASLEDIWSDSPWREQGCYLGDSLVQFHAHSCLSADMRLPARILRLWAQGQNPDGQVPCVVPAHMTRPHPDFTLLYLRFLRDYWVHSGDAEVIRDVWPAVEKLLASPTWITGEDGLIATNGGPLFIDWSVETEATQGRSSILNAFFIGALQFAAELAPVAGADPKPFLARMESHRTAFREKLWDEKTGRFLCTILPDGSKVAGRALHANTIAWAWDIATPEQSARILPWLLGELDDNARKIVRHHEIQTEIPRTRSGQLEPYFLFYLLDALGARGLAAEAESIVRDMWGLMRERGAITLWESILQTYFDQGSRCHSWAVAPLIHASRRLLGVTRPVPGEPDIVRVQPMMDRIGKAEGIAPHPRGPIRVSWHREGERFALEVIHPEGVHIECLPPPGIATENFAVTVSVSSSV